MRRGIVRALMVLGLMAASTSANAQGTSGTVNGVVRKEVGNLPLSDVRVQVVGTTLGAITNDRGEYRLVNVPAGAQTIAYNRIGYKAVRTRVVVIGGQVTTHNEVLSEANIALQQVVVTGTAGNQERRAQAASIATVNAAALTETGTISTVGELLTARTPGVAISKSSGSAGTANQIRIRGAASISLSNTPLIFVDGVRISEQQVSLGLNQLTDRLNDINPDDIESIEVVKGPAAASLYGADASAGVIQIITKRGKSGQQTFRQSIRYDYQNVDANFTPPSNFGNCTVALVAPTSTNPLCRGQVGRVVTGGVVTTEGTLVSDNPLVRTNAFKKGLDRAFSWTGRGGGANYSYFVSGGFDKNDGTLPNNQFDRYNGRVNFNFVPDAKWTVDANVNYIRSNAQLPDNDNNIYGFLGGGLLGSPLTRRDDGLPGQDGWFGFARQVAAISAIQNTQLTNRSIYGITTTYAPFSWFTNKLTAGGDIIRDELTRFFPKNSVGQYAAALNNGQNGQTRLGFERYTVDYLGNLRGLWGKNQDFETNLSFGAQTVSTRNESLSATGIGFVVNANNTVGSASQTLGGQGYSETTQAGFYGQFQVGLFNRIFPKVAMRVDQFSSFGRPTDRFYLPSFGVSYVISEEKWFKIPLVSNMRLRAAWGQTGRAPTAGAALTTYSAAPFISGTTSSSGVIPNNPGNNNLKAERGEETEFGVDFGMFKDRVNFELTYFDKKSKDLLLQQPQPPSLGFASNPFVNLGALYNKGLELGVNAQMLRLKNLSWDMRFTMNTLENKVTDLGGIREFFTGTTGQVKQDQPLGVMVAKKIISIDTVTNIVTVDSAYRAVNKPLPDFEAALFNSVRIGKYFTVSATIDTKRGFGVYNQTQFFRETQVIGSDNRLNLTKLSKYERLKRYGNPTPGQPAFVQLGGASTTVNEANEAFIQNGDFVRFRELSGTLALPESWASKLRVAGGSITLAAQNLKLWTQYQGPDPEVLSNIGSAFDRAEFLTIPTPRRAVLRVNLTY